MSNPVLNESTFEKIRERHAGEPGWAAATASSTQDNTSHGNTWAPPITDGPVSRYHSGVMTVSGAASASLLLFAVLLISAAVGWVAVAEPEPGVLAFPAMALVGAVVGFIAVGNAGWLALATAATLQSPADPSSRLIVLPGMLSNSLFGLWLVSVRRRYGKIGRAHV